MAAKQLIYLSQSSIGGGGSLSVSAEAVVLDENSQVSNIESEVDLPVGAGGVTISGVHSDALVVSADSYILTATPSFIASGVVGRLPAELAAQAITLADQCGVLFSNDTISSIVVTGRGGTPVEPGGWLLSIDLSDGAVDAAVDAAAPIKKQNSLTTRPVSLR